MVDHKHRPGSSFSQVLALLERVGPLTTNQITQQLGTFSRDTIRRTMTRLSDAGEVQPNKELLEHEYLWSLPTPVTDLESNEILTLTMLLSTGPAGIKELSNVMGSYRKDTRTLLRGLEEADVVMQQDDGLFALSQARPVINAHPVRTPKPQQPRSDSILHPPYVEFWEPFLDFQFNRMGKNWDFVIYSAHDGPEYFVPPNRFPASRFETAYIALQKDPYIIREGSPYGLALRQTMSKALHSVRGVDVGYDQLPFRMRFVTDAPPEYLYENKIGLGIRDRTVLEMSATT